MLREDCVCNMVGIRETKINDDGAHLHRGGDDDLRIGDGIAYHSTAYLSVH